jgi:Leu/Phe-tRNA-protein transferase
MIKKSFDETGDDNGSTPNVIAIMAAYRSGDLVWNDDPDSVTYWAHGKMIAGPKKMEMDEFLAISKEYGHRGVWVEGVSQI